MGGATDRKGSSQLGANFEITMAAYGASLYSYGGTPADPNPWNGRGSALGINLGDPARLLTVGRKHGLLPATTVQVHR